MKSVKLAVLFLAAIFVMCIASACGGKSPGEYVPARPDSPDTASVLPVPPAPLVLDPETGNNASTSDAAEHTRLSASEIMDAAQEETPTLEYICPYEISKCVATMEYTNKGEHITTWDIYMFNCDDVVGTWIINEDGDDITIYNSAFLYLIDNYNVHLGDIFIDGENTFYERHLCVDPDSFPDGNGFMIVTCNNISASDAAEYSHLSVSEIIDAAREETPTLEYTCPYEISKCVATMEYTYTSGDCNCADPKEHGCNHMTTWDIYLFDYDGVVGTWIVDETGNDISFYGDSYLYFLDNVNVHLGNVLTDGEKEFYEGHLCVYPNNLLGGNGFMFVSYPSEIQLPLAP